MSRLADSSALHKAFRQKSKTLHPDTTNLPPDEASRKFRLLCEAYELLADPKRRYEYDLLLRKVASFESNLTSSSFGKNAGVKSKPLAAGELRALSGGEWFSLLLLGVSLVFCLILGLGLAMFNGRDWQVSPSWLTRDQNHEMIHLSHGSNVEVAPGRDSIKPTLTSFS